jgi:pimeloyl-ACP methyl ester carboxylesterase
MFNHPQSSRPHGRELVIALHCSGGSPSQWRQFREALGDHELITPEHYGTNSLEAWPGDHAFSLADEAARVIEIIDRTSTPVHLVGHSYGGGVALRVAVERPNRIASMALYEPTAFHVLKQLGEDGAAGLREIVAVARHIGAGVLTGDYRASAEVFVDYWGGSGAWAALRPTLQQYLMRWVWKGPLDFHALIDEQTPLEAYRKFSFPVLVVRGEHAKAPVRLIAQALSLIPTVRLSIVPGAGHMGPLTHAAEVNVRFIRHIEATAGRRQDRALAASREASRQPVVEVAL